MSPTPDGKELEEIHQRVRVAIRERRPISAMYQGHARKLCPHVLGRNKQGQRQMLCYQYGGASQSGLRPEGDPANWRCIAMSGLSDVQLLNEPWQTAESYSRQQTCVEQIEVAVEDAETTRNKDSAEAAEAGGGQS